MDLYSMSRVYIVCLRLGPCLATRRVIYMVLLFDKDTYADDCFYLNHEPK